jgi:transposase
MARKVHTVALIASAKSEEEYLNIMQGIIQSQEPKTVLSKSNSSDSSSPSYSLGNDNEDDCFGILPPITKH